MDITVYLPDELGKWAKENDLALSRMLRQAVEAERRHHDAAAKLGAEATIHKLAVSERNADGGTDKYTARLHGTLVACQHISDHGTMNVYVGKDGKIYVHDTGDGQLARDLESQELQDYVDEQTYIEAMRALGEEVVIDLGLPQQGR